jgi:molybdopterin adenylyltransferase
MSVQEHRSHTARDLGCAVITVSDTRTEETDSSGARIKDLLAEAGHRVVAYRIVKDEPTLIQTVVKPILVDASVDAVFLTGGTGIAPRDTTFESVQALFEKEIAGFGELFRMLSWNEIGSAAMLSRASAGIVSGKIVFSMPGSKAAVELAMTKLALPELGHIRHLLQS